MDNGQMCSYTPETSDEFERKLTTGYAITDGISKKKNRYIKKLK